MKKPFWAFGWQLFFKEKKIIFVIFIDKKVKNNLENSRENMRVWLNWNMSVRSDTCRPTRFCRADGILKRLISHKGELQRCQLSPSPSSVCGCLQGSDSCRAFWFLAGGKDHLKYQLGGWVKISHQSKRTETWNIAQCVELSDGYLSGITFIWY